MMMWLMDLARRGKPEAPEDQVPEPNDWERPPQEPQPGWEQPSQAHIPTSAAYPGLFQGLLYKPPGASGLLDLDPNEPRPILAWPAPSAPGDAAQFANTLRLAAETDLRPATISLSNPGSLPPEPVPAPQPQPQTYMQGGLGAAKSAQAVENNTGPGTLAADDTPYARQRAELDLYGELAGVPGWKRDYLLDTNHRFNQADNWTEFNQALGYLPGIGRNEKLAAREIYAAEGGVAPDGAAVAGIGPQTLASLHAAGRLGDWVLNAYPENLTAGQRTDVYRAYMDDVLHRAGGHDAFEDIQHSGVAAFVADTVFREGDGTRMIQRSINSVLGDGMVATDGMFGRDTLDHLNEAIRTPEGRRKFASHLGEIRAAKYERRPNYEGERRRVEYFRDLARD